MSARDRAGRGGGLTEKKVYYAANTFYQRQKRPRLSLMQEQKINESTTCKIIGLTLETRPDCIDVEELRRLRRCAQA